MARHDGVDPLRHVDPDRREFLRKLLAGAFVTPVIASFSTNVLSVGSAEAGLLMASNTGFDCLPPDFYFEDEPWASRPHHVFKANFVDTNAEGTLIRVRATFKAAPDLGSIAFTVKLSRRQPATEFAITAAQQRESAPGVVEKEVFLLRQFPAGKPSVKGVVLDDPGFCPLGPLLAVMARTWGRLEVRLPDGSLLRGAIIPVK